jgi:integrase
MPRPQKPFNTPKRRDSKTFQITINPASGLPRQICREWQRKSFQDFPDALAIYRNPKTKAAAEKGAFALIEYLKKNAEDGAIIRQVSAEKITVGEWVQKFTDMESSPRTSRNAARNRPYSPDTLDTYRTYFNCHIKGDPIANIKMADIEEDDLTAYINRLSIKEKKDGKILGGTRTFAGILILMRMAFTFYQKKHKRWFNPFLDLDAPKLNSGQRDALTEDEIVKFFEPGVLKDTMELAVCACMFLCGLRRAEIAALKPDALDWHTPKILAKRAWHWQKDRIRLPSQTSF